MKISVVLASVAGLVAVSAQDLPFPGDFPECGRTCANNMQSQHTEIGCGESDFACLCRNSTFGYGIHDCSAQYCGNEGTANTAIQWAVSFCNDHGVPIALPLVNGTNVGTGSGGSSTTSTGGAASSASTSASTSASSASESISSASASASSVLSSASSASESASSASESASSVLSSITDAASSQAASITSAAGSAADSITSAAGSAASSVLNAGSSAGSALTSGASETVSPESSTGYAPQITAAPMAGIFIAGFAAALL